MWESFSHVLQKLTLTTPVVTNPTIQPCTTRVLTNTQCIRLVPTALVSRQNLDPSRTSLPLTRTQSCIFISPRGVTGCCLPIYRGILRTGPVSNPGDSGNSAVSACPGPHRILTPLLCQPLLLGSDGQTAELWKGRKSLGEAQRYFYRRLWPRTPIMYIRVRMLLHREKTIKIYRVLEGTVFIFLSAACPQSGSLLNGLLAPGCLLIGRISYRNGTGKESKLEGSADLSPPKQSVHIQPRFHKRRNCRCCNIAFCSGCVIPRKRQESSVLNNSERLKQKRKR